MSEYDDPVRDRSTVARAGAVVGAGVSYTLFGVGLASLASFFAPYVGVPALAWHTGLLPTVAAPTEGDAVVNAAPLILGIVLTALAVRIR